MSLEPRIKAAASGDAPDELSQPTLDGRTAPIETYRVTPAGRDVVREVRIGREIVRTRIPNSLKSPADPEAAFDWNWLRLLDQPVSSHGDSFRIADVFSGCGQMTVGAMEAARACGLNAKSALALDWEQSAAEACDRNLGSSECGDIQLLLDGELGTPRTPSERMVLKGVGDVDLLVGGPPCQGHSDLNNHTRRNDPRNRLSLKMVRFAELTRPTHVVLENVAAIRHDRAGTFEELHHWLEQLGYAVHSGVLKAEELGVAQRRRRMFLVATRVKGLDPALALAIPPRPVRDFNWACGDLYGASPASEFDQAPIATKRNQNRINYLHEQGLYELPDSRRPNCHKQGGHSYKSIYGRLHHDQPAQTITTGFRSMGQGRYVHPKKRRTITPHEAARLQFIPDFFTFDGIKSTATAKLIGNAVPPKMIYHVVLRLLAGSGAIQSGS